LRDWRRDDRPDRGPQKQNDRSRRDERPRASDEGRDKKEKVPAMPSTFIIVTVNDRLGTKAQIPCLPNDTVGDFKKLVAAHIGRQPHEIMLKRQGERPFKEILTLADYGVSNGVQLDLELDTGD
jgi:LAS seventeen-binding protein 5